MGNSPEKPLKSKVVKVSSSKGAIRSSPVKKRASSPSSSKVAAPEISPEESARRQRIIREVLSIVLGLLGIFSLVCIVAPHLTGSIGLSINYSFRYWFGVAAYLLPLLAVYGGLCILFRWNRISGGWFILLSVLLFLDLNLFAALITGNGGVVGGFFAEKSIKSAGIVGSYLFSGGLGLIVFMIITQISPKKFLNFFVSAGKFFFTSLGRLYHFIAMKGGKFEEDLKNSPKEKVPDLSPLESGNSGDEASQKGRAPFSLFSLDGDDEDSGKTSGDGGDNDDDEEDDEGEDDSDDNFTDSEEIVPPPPADMCDDDSFDTVEAKSAGGEINPDGRVSKGAAGVPAVSGPVSGANKFYKYRLPSLDLLKGGEKGAQEASARDYSALLEETLANFGVEVKVIDKVRGPTVTRYELQPARGVKVSKVTNLANDIALALAAYSIRIEAPIPGKSAIGIEVPNHRIDPVFLRDILSDAKYKKQPPLSLALGKDISGKAVMDDLLKMPHLLIAGATGSGKSVCINCVIASILFKTTPQQVQLVMVDPKRVELSLFEGIPHLVNINLPGGKKIITDPKAATLALKTISEIMDGRYEEFVEYRVRNIKEYNEKAEEPIPYIVVVIDELADLMMVSSSTVEQYICRIAQLGRASGIHLIVATQRPSVDVITGLIKANIPSRIAFAVSSQVDSRTILDRVGAEKLLGKGDMLYSPVDASESRRIQGAYVSGDEIEKVVDFWRQQPPPENAIPIEIDESADIKGKPDKEEDDGKDPLIPEAIEIIRATQQASVSNLQRKMKIGYARAGRIMDQLEKLGVVGPADGSKPRKILLPGF